MAPVSRGLRARQETRRRRCCYALAPGAWRSYFVCIVLFYKCDVMAAAQKLTVRLSTKGQVILPKSIRQRRYWDASTRLVIEETAMACC